MIQCPQCAAYLPDGMAQCNYCGHVVAPQQPYGYVPPAPMAGAPQYPAYGVPGPAYPAAQPTPQAPAGQPYGYPQQNAYGQTAWPNTPQPKVWHPAQPAAAEPAQPEQATPAAPQQAVPAQEQAVPAAPPEAQPLQEQPALAQNEAQPAAAQPPDVDSLPDGEDKANDTPALDISADVTPVAVPPQPPVSPAPLHTAPAQAAPMQAAPVQESYSVKQLVGMLVLGLMPFVGVVYCLLQGFGVLTPPTKRTLTRAMLVLHAAALGLCILALGVWVVGLAIGTV